MSPMANKQLKLIELNVNSLKTKNKQHELYECINEHKPDIVFLVETKLKPNIKIHFKDFHILRNDRMNNDGGGTAIVIKNNIYCEQLEKINTISSFEYTAIKIKLQNNKHLFCASIYKPPDSKLNTNELNALFQTFGNSNFIIAGDFNCIHSYWGNNYDNSEGNKLYNWLFNTADTFNSKIVPTEEPTCIRRASESYLDLFIMTDQITVLSPYHNNKLEIFDFQSDHKGVIANIYLEHEPETNTPATFYLWSNVNWDKVNLYINTKIEECKLPIQRNVSCNEIDKAVDNLNRLFSEIIIKFVPKLEIKNDSLIQLSMRSTKLIKQKKSLRRQAHRNRHRQNINEIWSQIRCLNNMIYNSIVSDYKKFWERKFKEIKIDQNIFKNIKKFSQYKRNNDMPTTLQINQDDSTLLSTPTDKANAFAKQFESVHKLTANYGDKNFNTTVEKFVNKTFNNNDCLINFSPDFTADLEERNTSEITINKFIKLSELNETIKSRNAKKTVGNDGVSNFMLKKLNSKNFRKAICVLFNHIINLSYMPKKWKEGIIVPIQKPGKNGKYVTNYRPICKLSCISKLLGKLKAKKIENNCTKLKLDFSRQFGFRPGTTTCHALLKITNNIAKHLNAKIPSFLVALDFEKAYDTLWIHGFIYKIYVIFGLDFHICKFLFHYLIDRSYKVQIGNAYSNVYWVEAGTPQGAVLSCLIYILNVLDFPLYVNGILLIEIVQYADDILIIAHTKNAALAESEINKYLNEIIKYLNKWKIKINVGKCEQLAVIGNYKQTERSVRSNAKNITIVMNGKIIPKTKTLKYLGLLISADFKFNQHIKYLLEKACKIYLSLKGILFNKNIKNEIKLLIYKQIIRPIIMYASVIWMHVSKAQIEKIKICERKFLRTCTGIRRRINSVKYYSNKKLYEKSNIIEIDSYIVNQAIKFFEKIKNADTDLKNIFQYNINDLERLNYYNTRPPIYLEYLNATNQLFNNNQLLYFNNLPTIHQFRNII